MKDFPEYKVAVDGHTDNQAIRSSLKKQFPTNKELSEAVRPLPQRHWPEGRRDLLVQQSGRLPAWHGDLDGMTKRRIAGWSWANADADMMLYAKGESFYGETSPVRLGSEATGSSGFLFRNMMQHWKRVFQFRHTMMSRPNTR